MNGYSVSLSDDGSMIAVSGPSLFNERNPGRVRVYEWENGSWVQVGLDLDGEAGDDSFDETVSLSGDGSVVAISAPQKSANSYYRAIT